MRLFWKVSYNVLWLNSILHLRILKSDEIYVIELTRIVRVYNYNYCFNLEGRPLELQIFMGDDDHHQLARQVVCHFIELKKHVSNNHIVHQLS